MLCGRNGLHKAVHTEIPASDQKKPSQLIELEPSFHIKGKGKQIFMR